MNSHERYSIEKYDRIADTYDTSLDGKFTAKFKQKMLTFCSVSDGDRVLDVGCGNGRLIYEISRKAEIKAYGIDISPKMIEVCKQQYGNIDFDISSGEDLPFDDGSFDMLTICCVLHHLNNPVRFFKEAHRVLRKNGTLIVGEPCFPFIIRKITDWIISPLLKAGDNKLFSHRGLKELFTSNGFSIVEVCNKEFKQIIKGGKYDG
ncbi:MAG: class I SAM-dependent methyltransferase [Dehalococcoidia bacterium]|nr:class I SAM-dependent methyltransferase [Dehalococcoidia bacterium]